MLFTWHSLAEGTGTVTPMCTCLLQVLVSEGGVLYLIHGLMHPDLEVSCCCSEMVARLAASQQQDALEAIRWEGQQGWGGGVRIRMPLCATANPVMHTYVKVCFLKVW